VLNCEFDCNLKMKIRFIAMFLKALRSSTIVDKREIPLKCSGWRQKSDAHRTQGMGKKANTICVQLKFNTFTFLCSSPTDSTQPIIIAMLIAFRTKWRDESQPSSGMNRHFSLCCVKC